MAETSKPVELMTDIRHKTSDVISHIDQMLKKAKGGQYDTSKGISFLEAKYQLLLSYLINTTYVFHRKVSGLSIKDDLSIQRLVEIRTVLEKMRPIDQKLKYQIDKLIKTAATGGPDEADPLRFKANPDNFSSKFGEDEDEDDDSEGEEGTKSESRSKVYVPPKLTAVHYDLDDTKKDKEAKALERAKRRALSSSVLKELRDEYYEGPEEIRDTIDIHRFKANKRAKERTEYEEERMVRLSVSKKEKNSMRKMGTMSSLANLTQFDDISILDEERQADFSAEKSGKGGKKRKLGGKGKKGKKGFKKRRK